MARVTVEDCLKNVKNRFELVILASKRARQLMRGKEPHVEWDNDKSTVVALREIAAGYTNFDTPPTEAEHDALLAPKTPVAEKAVAEEKPTAETNQTTAAPPTESEAEPKAQGEPESESQAKEGELDSSQSAAAGEE